LYVDASPFATGLTPQACEETRGGGEEEEEAEEEGQEEGGGRGQERLVGQKAQIVCAGAVWGIVGGFGGISWGVCMGGFA